MGIEAVVSENSVHWQCKLRDVVKRGILTKCEVGRTRLHEQKLISRWFHPHLRTWQKIVKFNVATLRKNTGTAGNTYWYVMHNQAWNESYLVNEFSSRGGTRSQALCHRLKFHHQWEILIKLSHNIIGKHGMSIIRKLTTGSCKASIIKMFLLMKSMCYPGLKFWNSLAKIGQVMH